MEGLPGANGIVGDTAIGMRDTNRSRTAKLLNLAMFVFVALRQVALCRATFAGGCATTCDFRTPSISGSSD